MGIRKLVLGFLILGVSLSAQATPLPRYGTVVYSSLCLDRGNTGDLNGARLVLVRLPLHDMGYLEWSDGSLSSAPLQDLKIDDKGGRISFSYLRDFDDRTGKSNVLNSVSSTITAESVGLVTGDGKPFRLARSRDVDKDLPNCH
jgi:hypothetical protein